MFKTFTSALAAVLIAIAMTACSSEEPTTPPTTTTDAPADTPMTLPQDQD